MKSIQVHLMSACMGICVSICLASPRSGSESIRAQHIAIPAKTVISFLGAPGAGKGTLAKAVVDQLSFISLSTGDLCREEIASGSEKGKMIAEYSMKVGLIPDEVIAEMVATWLEKNAGKVPIILDGYPRTQKQADMLVQLMRNKYADYVFGVVYLQITDEEEIVQRIANRLVCQQCRSVYNKMQLAEQTKLICATCGGTLARRADDEENIVRMRMRGFIKHNQEILAYYNESHIPVAVLSVSHTMPAQIFDDFQKLVSVGILKK